MQNDTQIRIPPAAHLGEVAYRAFIMQVVTVSEGSWATWEQLDDDDRHPWMMVGLVVGEAVKKANEHADR